MLVYGDWHNRGCNCQLQYTAHFDLQQKKNKKKKTKNKKNQNTKHKTKHSTSYFLPEICSLKRNWFSTFCKGFKLGSCLVFKYFLNVLYHSVSNTKMVATSKSRAYTMQGSLSHFLGHIYLFVRIRTIHQMSMYPSSFSEFPGYRVIFFGTSKASWLADTARTVSETKDRKHLQVI